MLWPILPNYTKKGCFGVPDLNSPGMFAGHLQQQQWFLTLNQCYSQLLQQQQDMTERFNRLENWVLGSGKPAPSSNSRLNIQVPQNSYQRPQGFPPGQSVDNHGAYGDSGTRTTQQNNQISEERNITSNMIPSLSSPGKVENSERENCVNNPYTIPEYLLLPGEEQPASQASLSLDSELTGLQGANRARPELGSTVPRLNLDNIARAKSRKK